ncbi:MAG: hypothetical protein NT132_09750 [Microbacterium sp.]|uniref:hypothetical protein n=1 Tax=Microbacterium sp. TaxID=51671 RepID=UPI002626CC3D|nr:hypothetical protein [Microbacterium sp.]MCX6502672.1 hypothetical protein [Microbacterium sp.]
MRSEQPLPGNPWPHDMVITLDDSSQALLQLLWLREAYDLPVVGDVPPPLTDTPARASRALSEDQRAQWTREWPRIWDAITRHTAIEHDPLLIERAMAAGIGSPERLELLQQMAGPSWLDAFGDDAFADPSYEEWGRRGFEAAMASHDRALKEQPERRDLAALVPAWERGLTTIVTIPCRGSFTRTLTPASLLVTNETRADSGAYRAALRSFVDLQH